MAYLDEKIKQILDDPYQREAYESNDSTVVIAGPGSGKTTILTLKIMKLLSESIIEPRGLACITYSREAAREFEDRLNLLGYVNRKNVFLGTVHSFCLSEILGKFAKLYDYGLPEGLTIISKKEKDKIFWEIVKEKSIKMKVLDMDKERLLSVRGNSEVSIEANEEARIVADEYERRLFARGFIDYEAIIIYSTKLIQEQDYVRKCLEARYPWIVIDEYQDLGRPLHEMVLSLFKNTGIKIFAVGDPDQSIYGFQGAKPDFLYELFRSGEFISVELKNNYRSNQGIIDGSELVLNEKRNYKAQTRDKEEAIYKFITCQNGYEDQFEYFIKTIIPECTENNIPLEEIAVLLGTKNDCTDLAVKCAVNNIPYYISKHTFERTEFVQWLEKCAIWLCDKSKVSFSNLAQYWTRVLALHRAEKILEETEKLKIEKSFLSVLTNSMIFKDSLLGWLNYIVDNLKIKEILKDSAIMPDEFENLDCLINEASGSIYSDYDISKFSNIGKPINQITISTRHSSKGLEFEVVVIMGMDEEHFPSWAIKKDPSKIYEENRICFVCISRAKRVVILMHSNYYSEYNNYYKDYQVKRYQPSRYYNMLLEKYGTD